MAGSFILLMLEGSAEAPDPPRDPDEELPELELLELGQELDQTLPEPLELPYLGKVEKSGNLKLGTEQEPDPPRELDQELPELEPNELGQELELDQELPLELGHELPEEPLELELLELDHELPEEPRELELEPREELRPPPFAWEWQAATNISIKTERILFIFGVI